ncbi:unnamed protein product [Caenorhabditis angaria]|uniref:Uncharacterized protein n=1 Tax=Caenorhabditis angaria TaxID=860376 RepID=A0A9P1MWV9_9PELO|nr:unnamed protein product [Caenorhabditis angaria]
MHIGFSSCLLLLLLFATCFLVSPVAANVAIIKMIVVGQQSDGWLRGSINEFSKLVSLDNDLAPQIFETYNLTDPVAICDYIGNVDREKSQSDFILVVKKKADMSLECDPEWGKSNFAILNIKSEPGQIGDIIFKSTENLKFNLQPENIQDPAQLLTKIKEKQKVVQTSQIPDEYPFKAERDRRIQQRIYMACISILVLSVVALLVIMFMTSLSRYNLRKSERVKAKKAEKEAAAKPHIEPKKPIQKKSAESSEFSKSKENAAALLAKSPKAPQISAPTPPAIQSASEKGSDKASDKQSDSENKSTLSTRKSDADLFKP